MFFSGREGEVTDFGIMDATVGTLGRPPANKSTRKLWLYAHHPEHAGHVRDLYADPRVGIPTADR